VASSLIQNPRFLSRAGRRLRPVYGVARLAIESWIANRGLSMGAAIAFYTVFSLGPALFLMITIAGLVSDADTAREAILAEFSGLIGPGGAEVIGTMIKGASRSDQKGLAALLGIGLLLIAATTVFGEIQQSLNVIWRAAPNRSVVHSLVRSRLASLMLIVVMGFIMLVALVISATLAAASDWLARWMPGVKAGLWVADAVLSLVIVTLLFAANYRILPDTFVKWRDAWIGAIAASVMFAVGKFAIGQYIGSTGVVSVLGAAGTPIVVLLWVYYSAQIFLLGAELAKANADHRGDPTDAAPIPIPPSKLRRPVRNLHHEKISGTGNS
jgi:membrane protein